MPYLGPTQTSAGDTARAYGLAKLRVHFGEFLRNEPGARLGESVDAVHDMRVAIRRLRAAISTLHEALPADFQRLSGELRWFGRALGEVRDLDVHIEAVYEAKSSAPDAAEGKRALIDKLRSHRDGARSRLVDALNSHRFEALVNEMTVALSQDGTSPLDLQTPVTQLAPDRIKHRYRKFRQVAKDSSPNPRRKSYTRCAFAPSACASRWSCSRSCTARTPAGLIDEAIEVQDRLGEHQDLHVLNERLGAIVRSYGRELEPAALVLAGPS